VRRPRYFSPLLRTVTSSSPFLPSSDTLFLCYAIDTDSQSTLLGAQKTPNQVVHRTLEVIFQENQNVVVYDEEEEELEEEGL